MLRCRRFALLSAAVPLAALAAGCVGAGSSTDKVCTLVACDDGIRVDFSYRDVGSYAVEVTVDGKSATCTATIPLSKSAPTADDPCIAAGFILSRIGAALPVEQQSIGGLRILSVNATRVTLRITRDGTLLTEGTFTPNYRVTPGPNGTDCDPKQCASATINL